MINQMKISPIFHLKRSIILYKSIDVFYGYKEMEKIKKNTCIVQFFMSENIYLFGKYKTIIKERNSTFSIIKFSVLHVGRFSVQMSKVHQKRRYRWKCKDYNISPNELQQRIRAKKLEVIYIQ